MRGGNRGAAAREEVRHFDVYICFEHYHTVSSCAVYNFKGHCCSDWETELLITRIFPAMLASLLYCAYNRRRVYIREYNNNTARACKKILFSLRNSIATKITLHLWLYYSYIVQHNARIYYYTRRRKYAGLALLYIRRRRPRALAFTVIIYIHLYRYIDTRSVYNEKLCTL